MAKVKNKITPVGTVVGYSALTKPDTYSGKGGGDSAPVYKVDVVFSDDKFAKGLKKEIEQKLADDAGQEHYFRNCVMELDEYITSFKNSEPNLGDVEKGIVFRFKAKAQYKRDGNVIERKLVLADSKGNRILPAALPPFVPAGSKIKVAYALSEVFDNPAARISTVTLYLNGVQLLSLDDSTLNGTMFGAEEGYDYEAEEVEAADADDVDISSEGDF